MCFAHEVFLAEVLPGYFVQYVDDESIPTSGWRPSFLHEDSWRSNGFERRSGTINEVDSL